MNDQFLEERARAVRSIADRADPFTKKRLLDLAERYEGSLALQLPFLKVSESMGNHDSKIVDAGSID